MTGNQPLQPLSSDQATAFQGVDSPTIANAIETFNLRDRTAGFIGGSIQCQFPDLPPLVGRALTVTMSSLPGDVASREGYWRMWDALDAMEGPVVLTIADVSGAPQRCAYAGEIMATLAQRLGAVGMVTDGALRDVEEVHALGFHYFMRFPVVSHGNFEIVSVGEPVVLDGERIHTGDILHGDRNGIAVIPDETLDGLMAAVATIRENEAKTMVTIRSEAFDYAAFKTRAGY